MRTISIRLFGTASLLVLLICFTPTALAGPFQLVSALPPGQEPPSGGDGDSLASLASADGRYVLFASPADNFVVASNSTASASLFPLRINVFRRDQRLGITTLVSINLTGQGGGNGDSLPAALSTNGQFALFESLAGDLAAADTNGASDIFLRDLTGAKTILISAGTNGGCGDGPSRTATMTPDGRYVVFVSAADNLVPGDTNGIPDIFVRDTLAGTTALVSVGAVSTNRTTPGSSSDAPDVTPDGRYVVFYSTATNLVSGAVNSGDIYVRDLLAGTTTWASSYGHTAVQTLFGARNAICYNHVISADGQFVAYEASPFPASFSSAAGVVLRCNLANGITEVVHTNAAVVGGPADNARSLAMTPDGRFIAFVANTNGVLGTTTCVCVWDAQSGTSSLVSGDLGGQVPTNSNCLWPGIDVGGRWVTFMSSATNLVTNSLPAGWHLYSHDTLNGTTALVDTGANGASGGLNPASAPSLSSDAATVVFEAFDGDLTADDRNRAYDVFARDLAAGVEIISAHDPMLPSLAPNSFSGPAAYSVSSDGRFVAFYSEADNLTPHDTNGCRDVFVSDLVAGTNVCASLATNGASADGVSTDPVLSPDGRYVAFTSSADNLAAGDHGRARDVFVRDLAAGTTTLVSINTNGTASGNGESYGAQMSADGRYFLFRTRATDIAAGSSSSSGSVNLVWRDLQTGAAATISAQYLSLATEQAAAMTPDGRFVAYAGQNSSAYLWDSVLMGNLYVDTNAFRVQVVAVSPDGRRAAYAGNNQLRVLDRALGTNWLLGPVSGAPPGLRFTSDGRFLACVMAGNGTNQVFLYDFQTGTNLLVSANWWGSGGGNACSDSPDISPDGRYVAYRSLAADLVPGDGNSAADLFLYDHLSGATTLVTASRYGAWSAASRSLAPAFSGDGRRLLFVSWAGDLLPNDFNTAADLFALTMPSPVSAPPFSVQILPGTPNGTPWLNWPASPGVTYRVQYKGALEESAWQDIYGGIAFVDGQGYFIDPTAGSALRFYRVVAF